MLLVEKRQVKKEGLVMIGMYFVVILWRLGSICLLIIQCGRMMSSLLRQKYGMLLINYSKFRMELLNCLHIFKMKIAAIVSSGVSQWGEAGDAGG